MSSQENKKPGGVWIYAQREIGSLHSSVYELLGLGRQLADDLSEPLGVILMGEDLQTDIVALYEYGADEVYVINNPALKQYCSSAFSKALAFAAEERKPSVILFPETNQAQEVASRAAIRLGTGLTVDCVKFKIENNQLIQIRPAFGSQLMAEIVNQGDGPAMACIKTGMFMTPERKSGRRGQQFDLQPKIELENNSPVLLKQKKVKKTENSLSTAKIVISGGVGIGSQEGFQILKKLAVALSGAVGGTRPAAIAGWVDERDMIGQTGVVISPDLYIAVGVSGAVQHMLGVSKSKYIVAINKNPDAPIFADANIGFIADYKELLPLVLRKLDTYSE